jgi:hypothetical protein
MADAIADAERLNAGGERGRAIAVAVAEKLTPDKVPFIDGYAEYLAMNGLNFDPPPATVSPPKATK